MLTTQVHWFAAAADLDDISPGRIQVLIKRTEHDFLSYLVTLIVKCALMCFISSSWVHSSCRMIFLRIWPIGTHDLKNWRYSSCLTCHIFHSSVTFSQTWLWLQSRWGRERVDWTQTEEQVSGKAGAKLYCKNSLVAEIVANYQLII